MRVKTFWFTVLLAGASSAHNIDTELPTECRAQSWVRAPDLVPGQVLRGEVKVKLDGPCPMVEKYMLGLRFKERSCTKLLVPGETLPDRSCGEYAFSLECMEIDSNATTLTVWDEALSNPSKWFWHEEERVAFETRLQLTHPNYVAVLPSGSSIDMVQEFGVLIPNTNYPPATMHAYSTVVDKDIFEVESMYEYFTEIHFSNGTLQEIHAGITSFLPISSPTEESQSQQTMNLTLGNRLSYDHPNLFPTNITIELSLPSGSRGLVQGPSYDIKAIVHRSGLSDRIVVGADSIRITYQPITAPNPNFKLKEPYSLQNCSSIRQRITQLHANLDDNLMYPVPLASPIRFPHLSTAHYTSPGVVSISSRPVIVTLPIDGPFLPPFTTYYQLFKGELSIGVNLKEWIGSKAPDVGDHYEWLPWEPMENRSDFLHSTYWVEQQIPGLPVVSSFPSNELGVLPTHYLSPDARTPLLIDESAVDDLLYKSPEERDLMAPIGEPTIREVEAGLEQIFRYYEQNHQNINVGRTWMKKMKKDMDHLADKDDNHLNVQ